MIPQAKAEARARKAAKLAGFIYGYRADGLAVTGAWVRALPQESRRTTEYLVGTRKGSDDTWELVAQIVDALVNGVPERHFGINPDGGPNWRKR